MTEVTLTWWSVALVLHRVDSDTHKAHRSRHMTKTSKSFQHFLISSPCSFTMATLSCCAPPPLPLLLLLLLPFPFAASVDLVVTTNRGQVRGTALTVLGGQVRAFLGIPYGKPPVGNLRFRVPQPADKWEGVREATQFSNTCFQLRDTMYPGRTPAGSASRYNKSEIYLLGCTRLAKIQISFCFFLWKLLLLI